MSSPLRVLIFDWGDTVMRTFPQYAGPMVGWPEVAAAPGATEALTELAGHYRLALATNARDSGSLAVRDALRRVRLDAVFDVVATSKEMGAAKPDPAFFRAVLARVGCAPDEAVMVGDSYDADVVGAKMAGLRAIWYNPAQAACPEPHPAYDAEISHLAGLPAVVAGLRLPDMPTCLAWLAEQSASEGLLRHVRLVAAIAFRLAELLRVAGEAVDPLLAHRGGLLHDLAKVSARGAGMLHDDLAGQLLRARGLPDLARIAERHPVWALTDPTERPETWEEKLVCYADRLADGGRLVGVEERLAGLVRRRPELAIESAADRRAALALESEISTRLATDAAALLAWLHRATAEA